eukprot:NODE_16726_length_980_cov_90.067995.p1 GENE.NODE_16726_length_980_cov_90.067995~~NODE_16726_length_980_cov_90.067995.p1  ORF type:complete len:227 (-),score=45.63 NODE_16726_length_980_cov_90.067995:176-856(-)
MVHAATKVLGFLACSATVFFVMNSANVDEGVRRLAARFESTGVAPIEDIQQVQIQGPNPLQTGKQASSYTSSSGQFIIQIVVAVIYWFVIASKYPKLETPKPAANEFMEENVCAALPKVGVSKLFYGCCCPAARAAHTYSATETFAYPIGVVLMTFIPCIAVFIADYVRALPVKLGGEKLGCCHACLLAWCCWPCVVCKEAEGLDRAVGVETGLCGFVASEDYHPV